MEGHMRENRISLKLTENDDIRIIFPNKELRDFVKEALPCAEFEVGGKVVPNSEEVEALVLVDPWARKVNGISEGRNQRHHGTHTEWCTDTDLGSTNLRVRHLPLVQDVFFQLHP
jgi:hypothetical protein